MSAEMKAKYFKICILSIFFLNGKLPSAIVIIYKLSLNMIHSRFGNVFLSVRALAGGVLYENTFSNAKFN
ncbi:hypothetical protein EGI31_08125 [Lacihabitans soyangensis]|uniref:Uncharacterized protein n=1 Tax=Lacihabitans soyangensis TaxID=869394 RepID=A0AAE3KS47_9BACT|nr:hypothetical protein [Lacihabitans soyangensis]